MSRYVPFHLDDIPAEYLDKLVESGLYGSTVDDVLNGFILAGIREALERRFISHLVPEPEEVFEVDPEPPPQTYGCTHCHDGDILVVDATAAGACPKCGANCLPF